MRGLAVAWAASPTARAWDYHVAAAEGGGWGF
jgi:hypothetical protein